MPLLLPGGERVHPLWFVCGSRVSKQSGTTESPQINCSKAHTNPSSPLHKDRTDADGGSGADGAGSAAHSVTDTLCAVRDAAAADVKWAAVRRAPAAFPPGFGNLCEFSANIESTAVSICHLETKGGFTN